MFDPEGLDANYRTRLENLMNKISSQGGDKPTQAQLDLYVRAYNTWVADRIKDGLTPTQAQDELSNKLFGNNPGTEARSAFQAGQAPGADAGAVAAMGIIGAKNAKGQQEESAPGQAPENTQKQQQKQQQELQEKLKQQQKEQQGLQEQQQQQQQQQAGPTKGMGGRVLSQSEQAEFDNFGVRAKSTGLVENPNRTGSWGTIDSSGKFNEVTRIDVGEAGKPGWQGQTHIHITGQGDHLPVATKLPGEP
jgi:hypothetical protein